MPPEDEREEEEPEEGTHIKTDRRVSRQAEQEPTEEETPEGPAPETEEQPVEEKAAEEPPAGPEETPQPEGEAAETAPEITVYGLLRMSIGMYVEQAWIHLGVRMDPSKQKTEENLPLAKVAIDTVAFLVEQLQPDLDDNEKRELESLVTNLRINYVQRS